MAEAQDFSVFVRHPAEGVAAMDLVVEGVHCGACISTIEKGLGRESGVRGARVNLASKRVTVEWDDGALEPAAILDRLSGLGYPAYPFAARDRRQRRGGRGEAAAALPRRRRLRRDERHADLGRAVVGRGGRPRAGRRAISSIGSPRSSRCRPSPTPGGRSSTARCGRCARPRSTWTCRSPSASCWRCCCRSCRRCSTRARPISTAR